MVADPGKPLDQAYRPPGKPPLVAWPEMIVPICRAVWELARARVHLSTLNARDITRRNKEAKSLVEARGVLPQSVAGSTAAKVAYFIPRIARRVPWRSDCLVQAIAAQHWLADRGIASEIVIGVQQEERSGFAAHAWLRWTDVIVTGGDIGNFTELLDPNLE